MELETPAKENNLNVENEVDSGNNGISDSKDVDENQKGSENEECRNSDKETEMEKDEQVESEDKEQVDAEKPTEESSVTEGSKVNENPENKETENSQSKEIEIVANGSSEADTKESDKNRIEIDDDDDVEDDDDFNPLLLCPDISMDVDESPVLTESTESSHMNDEVDSNSLFEPLFSTFVDEMTGAEISFNLTAEEQQLREKLYGPNNPIQFTKIHCTACNVHLGSALAGQTNRFVHPLLKVLICKECYHFYTSGEFEKDEDGSELYCRWCGQGGQVLCCTMCEYVFCKKCIRINFGRKKLTQVRDSEEWKCFRCDVSQLKALRAMCVEFFEYIRRETARASTYTDVDIVNKDLTNCCQAQNRKRLNDPDKEGDKEVVKRSKRRKNEDEDPDYNPYSQPAENGPSSPVPSTSGVKVVANVTKPNTVIHPKMAVPRSEVSFPGQSPSSTVRIGNTIINVKSLGTVSQTSISPSVVRNTAIRTPVHTNIRPKQSFTPRTPLQMTSNLRPAVTPAAGSLASIRSLASNKSTSVPIMKHEWFEKTVRAAARVNSNLSYTLTQLNKAQSSASSVEQLAVVHNKLQEILSSSINSLIQIRKNLRTEFIAGIKTIRFPPKPAVDPNDDDVIIVNTETSTSNTVQNNKGIMPAPAQLSIKRVMKQKSSPNRANTNNSPNVSNNSPNKGYLKVRSFSQLQNVSSECITIPDDDPAPSPNAEPITVEVNEEATKEDPLEGNNKKKTVDSAEDKNKNSEETGTDKVEEADADKIADKDTDRVEDTNADKVEDTDVQNKETEKVPKERSEVEEETPTKQSKKDKKGNCENEKNKDKCVQNGEKINEENQKTIIDSDEKSAGKSKNTEGSKSNDSNDSDKGDGNLPDGEIKVKKEPEEHSYNVKDQPTPKIRRMLSVKVNLKKTTVVEDLVKQEPVENGDN